MGHSMKYCLLLLTLIISSTYATRKQRSINLSAAHSLISETKLPGQVTPNNYTIVIRPNLEEFSFNGKAIIILTFVEPTNRIILHAAHELEIDENEIKLSSLNTDGR